MINQTKSRAKIWAVFVGIFILGCVTGASIDNLLRTRAGNDRKAHDRRHHKMERYFERLQRDLNLTEQQATEIRAILDETHKEYRTLRSEIKPKYDEARQKARTRIRALLSPEQQQQFDAINESHRDMKPH
jgi:Spy/CpxP family protein refolding chaperone